MERKLEIRDWDTGGGGGGIEVIVKVSDGVGERGAVGGRRGEVWAARIADSAVASFSAEEAGEIRERNWGRYEDVCTGGLELRPKQLDLGFKV